MTEQQLREMVRAKMNKKGITSYQIKKKTKLHHSTVDRWLAGGKITLENFLLILSALRQ